MTTPTAPTTADMCAHQETRDRLHDVYMALGMAMGGGFSWLSGDAASFTVIGIVFAVVSWIRATLAARRLNR